MGVLFLVALVLPVLRARLPEPPRGRGLPAGGRSSSWPPATPATWPSTCCPTCAPSSARRGRRSSPATAPSWPAIRSGRDDDGSDPWDADDLQERTTTDHGADPQRRHPRARGQDQPVHAVLRQRGAAQARPAGRHGRAGHRALRDGRADGLPGFTRRADRPGQPHHVHGAAGGGHAPRRAAPGCVGGAVHRPRPLQAGQRPGGPFGRRPGPQRNGQPAHRHDTRGGPGGALRRRRVRGLRRGRPSSRCARHGRAHPDRVERARRHRRTGSWW